MFRLGQKIRALHKDEDGAITVDWVVLSAAVIALAIAVIAQVEASSLILADRISVATENFLP